MYWITTVITIYFCKRNLTSVCLSVKQNVKGSQKVPLQQLLH